jgi:tetratricopeptide (TPR) repeat protein
VSNSIENARRCFESGLSLFEQKDFVGAKEKFLEALSIAPDRPSILINLSATLMQLSQWAECEKVCRKILSLESENYDALLNLSSALLHMDKAVEALQYLDKAILISPDLDLAWTNKGNILQELGKFDQADECFNRALTLNPLSQEALIGRGNLRNEKKEYQLALEDFDRALKLNPSNSQAKWNKALSLLRLGNFIEGWKLYESRWEISGMREHKQYPHIPTWLGKESLKDKTILVYAEQGYGDTIQFCRYLTLLEKQGATIIFEVQKSLVDLMKTLSPRIHVVEKNVWSINQEFSQIDFQCPIMSLPLAFRTTLETIPNSTPYLFADKNNLEAWRNKLDEITKSKAINKPFRVGITWSGSGHYAGKKNAKRDIPIEQIASLINQFSENEIEFHSMQVETQKNMALRDLVGDNFFVHDSMLQNFSDTAALMSRMDLIISIDTANAHLGGALNIPTLLLIPDPPDFMALTNRSDSPWYPLTTIIRQERCGIWSIDNIAISIKRLMQ